MAAVRPMEVNPASVNAAGWVVVGVTAASLVAYLLVAYLVVRAATWAYAARRHRPNLSTGAPGLIFPLMLLERCRGDEAVYAQQVAALTPADILRDYAQQVVEVSAIYRGKQEHVNRAGALFRWLVLCWVVAILLLLAIPFLIRVV